MASAQDQIYSAQELEAFVDYGEGEEEEEEDQQYAQGSNPERPYVCMFRDERTQMICGKDYPRRCDLTKHQNNHKKKHHCGRCTVEQWAGGAEKKDLDRHMWSNHPNSAREGNVKRDEKKCRYCDHKGRADNVKRHMETCKHRKGHGKSR